MTSKRMLTKVTFLRADQGGRFSPPSYGYSPQIKAGECFTSCIITDDENSVYDLGCQHDVFIKLRFWEEYGKFFSAGDDIVLQEGSKVVGRGVIVAIECESR